MRRLSEFHHLCTLMFTLTEVMHKNL